MTQENLLDAVVEDLKRLFQSYTLANSLGVERAVNIYRQDLPYRKGDDEGTDPEAVPEPYILVRIPSGELPQEDSRQTVDVALVICVYDPDPNRQGYRDALHIVNAIMGRYAANGVVGKRYVVQYPIRWVTQEEETHPYYYAGVALTFDAPAIFKEVPET